MGIKGEYKSVILIGVDGGGAWLDDAKVNLKDIFGKGAVTRNCLTAIPSISAQCWGSMLTGVWPDKHKFTNDLVSSVEHDINSEYPTIFRMIRKSKPEAELAAFCNWNPIYNGIIEHNLDVLNKHGDDEFVKDCILEYLDTKQPALLFVQFDSVDGAGHRNGYQTEAHFDQISLINGYIHEVYSKLNEKGYLEDTLFLVTADHGGKGNSHGGDSDEEKYIYFGAAGKTVNNTADISMEVLDIPSIIAYALGVECSSSWDSYIPQNLFMDNMSPAKHPVPQKPEALNVQHRMTPVSGEEYISFYLDKSKIIGMLTFDSDTSSFAGSLKAESYGKVYYVEGVNGNACRISAEGAVRFPELKFGSDSIAIASWVRVISADENALCLFSNKVSENSKSGFSVSLSKTGVICSFGGSSFSCEQPENSYGSWMHIIVSADRKNRTLSLYINFTKAAESTFDDVSFDCENGVFQLGRNGCGSMNGTSALDVELDDFIVYKGALSDSEVTTLYRYYK